MAPPSLLRLSSRPYVCAKCTSAISSAGAQKEARRWIGLKYLAKVADAEMKWQEQAIEIRAGKKKSVFTILEERGLVHDTIGTRKQVDAMMIESRVGAYVGVDPTGPSLHIGHMLPLMSLFWMYVHGYHTVTLVGGATAKIGDPTDRLEKREHAHKSIQTINMVNIHYQMKKIWLNVEAYALRYGYRWEWAWKRGLLNNNAWQNKLGFMEVLQIMGPGVRIGTMLAKDTVKNKMSKGDGMSFSEFSYPLLQAWDWWHMYNSLGIRMQIGGSDQLGNISAGVDAVKYVAKTHPAPDMPKKTTGLPFGFTTPLLTTSSGAKFGKSAGNAVWLDKDLTSAFELYGYFLRTSDEDVGKHLKLFTFMPIEEIDALLVEHKANPSLRKAQHKLATEFLELVHGAEEAKITAQQHQLLFNKSAVAVPGDSQTTESDPVGASALELPQITLNNRPKAHINLPRTLIEERSIGRILYAAGLASSASEGHRLAGSQAVYVGGGSPKLMQAMSPAAISWTQIKTWKVEDTKKFLIDNNLLMLRRGRNNIRVINVVEDDVYEASMARYPGDGKDKVDPDAMVRVGPVDLEYAPAQKKGKKKFAEPDQPRQFDMKSGSYNPLSRESEYKWSSELTEKEEQDVDDREELTPEARLRKLTQKHKDEEKEFHAKMDKKFEPKGDMVRHGDPTRKFRPLKHLREDTKGF